MGARQVVVIGGTGFYGRYLVEDLLRDTGASILVAARRPTRSQVTSWAGAAGRVDTVAVDHEDVATLTRIIGAAACVVHCAGPFQAIPGGHGHPLGPVRAALAAAVPYIDICEDRAFRRAVVALGAHAPAPVLTGASVVPGMQVLAAAELASGLDDVVSIRCAAAPDTRRHRGDAMFRAMLHGAGSVFLAPRDGALAEVRGWSEPEWLIFPPPLGRRLVYQVYEMADLDVLVELFGVQTVSFKAGSEFSWLNRALGTAAALRARTGWPRRLERFTPLVRAASWLAGRAGDEAGGFVLEAAGHRGGRFIHESLGMTSEREGGRIPSLLAAIAVEEVLAGRLTQPGIVPLEGWIPAGRVWDRLSARKVALWRRTDGSPWLRWR